jgi:ubiquinone/menaquinone biosynthesis C-methylase UbiE
MDSVSIEYCKKQKSYFNNDGWWGKTPLELANDTNKTMKSFWHDDHDNNPEYWNVLYGDITKNPELWEGKTCFDFGFGFGGNLKHLSDIANWDKLTGCDIAENFVPFGEKYLELSGIQPNKIRLYETNGYDLTFMVDECVDFLTSTVVLQHIALYQVRYNLLSEFYRVMKTGAIMSIQFNSSSGVDYYTTNVNPELRQNCCVSSQNQVINDLIKIGFDKDKITYYWSYNPMLGVNDKSWLYIRAIK